MQERLGQHVKRLIGDLPVVNSNHKLLAKFHSGIELFLMSSCIATNRLLHNGGYIQNLSQRFNSPEILRLGRLYLLTKLFLNLDGFYSILLQYSTSNPGDPPLWTSL